MLQEDKQILWKFSAVMLGIALPGILIGKALMFALLGLGLISGLMATKDESLRATMRLLLNSWYTVLVLALLGSLLVGVVTGIDPSFAFDKWQKLILVLVCAGLLFVVLREMPGRHLEILLKALAIATMTIAIVGVVDALAGSARISTLIHGPDKALTPYRLNFVSSALAVLLPFVWARLLLKSREGEPFAQRIALPAASFGILAALICGGRAGWVGLVMGVLAFMWLAGRYHGVVMHARHYLGAGGLIAAGLALYGQAMGWQFMIDRVTIVGEEDMGRGILSGRTEVWGQALAHVFDKPLFGIGMMNYRNLDGSIDLHPHNWALQMLLEGGVISTVLFLVIVGMVLRQFFYYAKGNIYGAAGFASIMAFMVAGLANTSIFNPWWLGYLVFACLLGWRAGWGGVDLKRRRRAQLVKN